MGESHEAFQLRGLCCHGACKVYVMSECVCVCVAARNQDRFVTSDSWDRREDEINEKFEHKGHVPLITQGIKTWNPTHEGT